MSQVTVNGTSGAYLQPREFGLDDSGGYIIAKWQGTRAAILAQVNALAFAGIRHTYKESFTGAADEVEARFVSFQGSGGVEVPEVIWEYKGSQNVEKDILRAPAVASALTAVQKKDLRDYIANPDNAPSGYTPGSVADQIFNLIKSGETSVLTTAPSVSRSYSVSPTWAVKAAQANKGRIISTLSMFTLEGFPTDLIFDLDNDVDPIVTTDDPVEKHYGWFKNGPDVQRIAYKKTSVQQTFTYGLWPRHVYGLPL